MNRLRPVNVGTMLVLATSFGYGDRSDHVFTGLALGLMAMVVLIEVLAYREAQH